uniref:Ig-like domain-containing protein n=1 Tax=Monodelphis domestica TaxID=13616 RepID=A0A5F8GR79_MONDO
MSKLIPRPVLFPVFSMLCHIFFPPCYVLIKEKGQEAKLRCKQNLNHDYMYWYRQDDQQSLETMFIYNSRNLFGNFTNSSRFRPESPDKVHLNLQIESVQPKDTATYFCASSDTVLQSLPFSVHKPPPRQSTGNSRR